MKEIDPFAFEEALRMNPIQKKVFAVKQDEDDRKNFDKKWEKLNVKLKQGDSNFTEPDCKNSLLKSKIYRSFQIVSPNQGLQRTVF